MKTIIPSLFFSIILISCDLNSNTSSEIIIDRFVFDANIPDTTKQYFFVESQFFDLSKPNHFEEITWISCNENDFNTCFETRAIQIKINQRQIKYGSYLFTLENEYLHIKLKDGRTGWIRDPVPIPIERKVFLKNYLQGLIDKDRKQIEKDHSSSFYKNQDIISVNGYLKITHFKDNRFALMEYSPILKVTSYDYNLTSYRMGYLVDIKEQKIHKNSLLSTGQIGMNFDSNYVFEVRRDPYYFKALDQYGNTIK